MVYKCVYSKSKKNKSECNRTGKSKSKSKSKSKRTLKKNLNKRLKGGSVTPCLGSPDVSKYMQNCSSVNLHNTNPEANYSLINGGGVLPTPIVMKGGNSCTPIPSQPNPLTFTDYLNRAGKEISGGSSNGVSSNIDNGGLEVEQVGNLQSGGSGYSINPEDMIGGLPSHSKYDSCCQPAILGNKLVFGNNGNSVCGSQVGGKKRRNNKKKTSSKSKSKLSNAKQLTSRKSKSKAKKTLSSRKGKKGMKTMKKGNKKGGFMSKYPFTGKDGDFGYLPDNKDYGGKQPYWGVNTR